MMYLSLMVVAASALISVGRYQLLDRFRTRSPARALRTFAAWCRWALPWLGVHVEVDGVLPNAHCVYVANHRSYLDVPILAGALEAVFLSRADVSAWPVIGTVARAIEVVFVDRKDADNRARSHEAVLRRLQSGSIILFPEGTTGGGRLPGSFYPGLFRTLHEAAIPLVPVTLRYDDRSAYWVDDLPLWQHFKTRVLGRGRLRACVHVGSVVDSAAFPRPADLAAAVHAAVCRPIEIHGELL